VAADKIGKSTCFERMLAAVDFRSFQRRLDLVAVEKFK
jgi:hypothetical protein